MVGGADILLLKPLIYLFYKGFESNPCCPLGYSLLEGFKGGALTPSYYLGLKGGLG